VDTKTSLLLDNNAEFLLDLCGFLSLRKFAIEFLAGFFLLIKYNASFLDSTILNVSITSFQSFRKKNWAAVHVL